jgi:hypothetical protein
MTFSTATMRTPLTAATNVARPRSAIDRMNKNLVVARKQLDAARASLVGTDKAEELVSTETDGDVAAQAEVRVASAIAGNGLWHRPLPLTAIPAALAWPPPTAAAHDPPR